MATDREPEAWQTNAHAPWARLEAGVTIETIPGERDRHRVTWPGAEEAVDGHDAAIAFAHRKVAELSAAPSAR